MVHSSLNDFDKGFCKDFREEQYNRGPLGFSLGRGQTHSVGGSITFPHLPDSPYQNIDCYCDIFIHVAPADLRNGDKNFTRMIGYPNQSPMLYIDASGGFHSRI
jgi:hypothetical protein